MPVSYCFRMKLCGWYNAQFGLRFAVIFVENLVGEIVRSAE